MRASLFLSHASAEWQLCIAGDSTIRAREGFEAERCESERLHAQEGREAERLRHASCIVRTRWRKYKNRQANSA